MRKALLSLLLIVALPVMASHIVGGEFELLFISGNSYKLNLILYFDLNNGLPGAKDQYADVSIYRKSDNQLMSIIRLPLITESEVSYTQPACSNGEISTNKLTYSSTITLAPASYDDPSGYYVTWQRCCRNYTITNIYSQNPGSGGTSAGQTFYLEFPPVVKDGKQFIDSTPQLFPPLNDYACKGKPYYVDFKGTDIDGDSLVYTMVTPLNTKSADALPESSPLPYPEVVWRTDLGFGPTNIIKGKPDLKISRDGLLTATPSLTGLFVFAVKVEEFRDKKKIGESRRDFQMLVLDCANAVPPKILGKKSNDVDFSYVDNMNVSFSNTVADDKRCIQVRVSDDDSKNSADGKENITIRVVGLNFKSSKLNSVLPSVTTTTLINGSTTDFSVCFPKCPFINGPYQIGIIAFDDACSLPLMDTLKVTVDTEPPFNTPPYFVTPTQPTLNQVLMEGETKTWPFEIVDDQQDEIIPAILTNGFVLSDAGMKLEIPSGQPKGSLKGTFSWNAYCDIYDFTKRTSFQVTLQADDNDACNADLPIKRIFNLSVLLPPVDSPVITTDLVNTYAKTINLEKRVNESINFNVYATEQTDQSTINLNLTDLSSLTQYGVNFANASGKKSVISKFNWDILCAKVDPSKRSNFTFQFIASDNTNKCHFVKSDTVSVIVKVSPSLNNKPVLTVSSLNALKLNNGTMDVTLGQPIQLLLTGTDSDFYPEKDNLTLKLTNTTGTVEPTGFTFSDISAKGTVTQNFTWAPDCSIFRNGIYSNNYAFTFKLTDDRCYTSKSDSAIIKINIKDVENTSKEFLPANVITPNDDGCNDYFAVEGFDDSKCGTTNTILSGQEADGKVSLPLDNCIGQFQGIIIYNRWGAQVFKSSDRKFRWYALQEASGVYFFSIKYGNKEYKGTISVRN